MANPTEIPLENILLYDGNGKYLGTAAQNSSAATGQKTGKDGGGFLSFLSGLTSALSPALSALFPNGIGGNGSTTTTTTGAGGIAYVPAPQTNTGDSTVLLVGAALVAFYFISQDKPKRRRI